VCHCAASLADSLAERRVYAAPRRGLPLSYLSTVEKCSGVIKRDDQLRSRQRRLKARFQAAEHAREIPQVTGFTVLIAR
jgi:hypothetical protein